MLFQSFFSLSLFRGILSRSLSISSARPPGQVKEGIIDFSIEKMWTTDMRERSASSDKSSSSSTQRPYFILGKSRESDIVARLAWILRPPNSKYPAGALSLSLSILTITTHIYTSSMDTLSFVCQLRPAEWFTHDMLRRKGSKRL